MRRGLAGIEPTPARPKGAGYARLNLSATAGIGTTFNESTIMDKVIEKMSKLNNSNQSMNNTVLNQSTAVPAPPQVPRPARAFPPPSTLNFKTSSYDQCIHHH